MLFRALIVSLGYLWGGYSLKWPIRGSSARKGYLFQASGIWKGRDFTLWSIWKGRGICHLGLLKEKERNMCLLVTLRFLSNLPITLIASLLYFFHVSVVCFNVWLKPSTKDNVVLNSVYKSCPLFVLHILTTKIELSMPVHSLNIDLSNAAICILFCSSAFMKKDLPSSKGSSFLRK